MNIFLSIRPANTARDRTQIEAVCKALETCGHHVICTPRDILAWGARAPAPNPMMRSVLSQIDKAELVLVEFTDFSYEQGIEFGYARGKNIPVIAIGNEMASIPASLQGVSSRVIRYKSVDELITIFFPEETTDLIKKSKRR